MLEIREELIQDAILAFFTADVTRMAFHVVNSPEIIDGDAPVTGLIQFLESLVHDIFATLIHRWLNKGITLSVNFSAAMSDDDCTQHTTYTELFILFILFHSDYSGALFIREPF